MRHELHYEYHKNILAILDAQVDGALELIRIGDPLVPTYHEVFEVEESVLDIVIKSALSKPLAELDRERDQAYAGLVASVKSMSHHHDPEMRDASERIADILKHYGNVAKKNYEEESAAISDLLREVDKPELNADIVKLGVVPWRDRLETLNDKFEAH